MSTQGRKYSRQELAVECAGFLSVLCDTTVGSLKARKNAVKRIHANIKTLTKPRSGSGVCYEVVARSQNPDRERVLEDGGNFHSSLLTDNAFYQGIVMSRGKTDFCHVPHIEKFLESWGQSIPFEQPNPRTASRFYKSCLVVAIQGPNSSELDLSLPEDRATHPFGDDGTILGFICVDSKDYEAFDLDWDLDIMREISSKAFNALRIYYAAQSSVRMPRSVS